MSLFVFFILFFLSFVALAIFRFWFLAFFAFVAIALPFTNAVAVVVAAAVSATVAGAAAECVFFCCFPSFSASFCALFLPFCFQSSCIASVFIFYIHMCRAFYLTTIQYARIEEHLYSHYTIHRPHVIRSIVLALSYGCVSIYFFFFLLFSFFFLRVYFSRTFTFQIEAYQQRLPVINNFHRKLSSAISCAVCAIDVHGCLRAHICAPIYTQCTHCTAEYMLMSVDFIEIETETETQSRMRR